MRGVQKVVQVDMLDWKTFQNLYTDKTHIFHEPMSAYSGCDVIVTDDVIKRFMFVLPAMR